MSAIAHGLTLANHRKERDTSGRSPTLEILGKDTVYVTKLSDDPFVPVTKARMLAADLDLTVHF